MASYWRGSRGKEVERIQARLRELGHYTGPIDGDFGGGTWVAVKTFQRAAGLEADGIIGPATWDALFAGQEIPVPEVVSRPLAHRCVALTGSFETSTPDPECFCAVTGDFDDQGLSFGVLQWCLGQGSLQPLLGRMDAEHPRIVDEIFDEQGEEFRQMLASGLEEQKRWARGIQDARHRLAEPWRGLFKTLGRRPEFQGIQVEAARHLHEAAVELCRRFGLRSQRAVALMFDIKVQNGSISPLVEAQIRQDFQEIDRRGPMADETEKLRAVAERRAAAANPRWVEDVRRRKLTIAHGEGIVHGNRYDLEVQFGIGLAAAL